jgi:hypothetical protein
MVGTQEGDQINYRQNKEAMFSSACLNCSVSEICTPITAINFIILLRRRKLMFA